MLYNAPPLALTWLLEEPGLILRTIVCFVSTVCTRNVFIMSSISVIHAVLVGLAIQMSNSNKASVLVSCGFYIIILYVRVVCCSIKSDIFNAALFANNTRSEGKEAMVKMEKRHIRHFRVTCKYERCLLSLVHSNLNGKMSYKLR